MNSSVPAGALRSSHCASAAAWAPPPSSNASDPRARRLSMKLKNFRFETDADGVAVFTWDMPGRSMNVINPEVMAEIGQIVDRISSDAAVKGAVITLGKGVGGADLTFLKTA